jgi:hypothetical protein
MEIFENTNIHNILTKNPIWEEITYDFFTYHYKSIKDYVIKIMLIIVRQIYCLRIRANLNGRERLDSEKCENIYWMP